MSPVRISGPPRGTRARSPERRVLRRRAGRLLAALGVRRAELSVVLAADPEIAALNARFRGRGGPTDVLSFSLLEGAAAGFRGGLLGDVVIGVEVAARQARRRGRSLDEEVARLLIHGVLHLLGYDHERDADARVMRAQERRLWRSLGE